MLASIKYGNLRSIQNSTKRILGYQNSSLPLTLRYSLNSKWSSPFNNQPVRNFHQKELRKTASSEDEVDKKKKKEKEMIHESMTSHKALEDKSEGKTSKMDMWRFIRPYLYSDGNRKVFYLAMT